MSSLQLDADRTALSKEALKIAFLDDLFYVQGKFPALATKHDYYMALAFAVRDRMLQRWISTAAAYTKQASRTVAYLSAEFLMGPHLGNNLINLGILDQVKQFVGELGLDFEELLADMPSTLGRVADHLNINADQRQIEVVASGGTMQRYSKAPEHAYSPALRTDILRDSRQRNAAEIRTGLQWLETMTRTHPQLAAAHGSAQ